MTQEITNWRSLGGYVGAGGKKVKDGMLFRTGQLFDLTAEQKADLQYKYQIKRIFDFRGDKERSQYPDYLWDGVDYVVLDVLKAAKINQASVDEIVSGNSKAEEDMLITYEELALTDSARHGYHDFLLKLITDPVPMAFHCYAGKDRTGVGAALILKSLDVSDDQIFDDYLKTIEARKDANAAIINYLKDKLTPAELDDVSIALTVQRAFLKRYYTTIEKNYGGFDQYFVKGLNLPADFKNQMQKIYLV